LSSGHCPPEEEKAVEVATAFMAKHPDFVPGVKNSAVMVAYMQANNDPIDARAFERAFKDLKKQGKIELRKKP
jgi:hypothetical protein